MQNEDVERLRRVVALWRTTRTWAEDLLCDALGLARARDVLRSEHRGERWIPGTDWSYRTHENGVAIDRGDGRGGIDFDFDTVRPDTRQLRTFIRKQIDAGALPSEYAQLIDDEPRLERAVRALLASDKASFEDSTPR
jgi:hypothetical protein